MPPRAVPAAAARSRSTRGTSPAAPRWRTSTTSSTLTTPSCPATRSGSAPRATARSWPRAATPTTPSNLPDGRYLISVRSLDHKMWGTYITLPDDAAANGTLTARIDLTEQSDAHPLPLGKIRVFVFQDNAWTNGAPDTEEGGLNGFQVGLEEQTGSAVTVDYNNDPLCGGICKTAGAGANAGFARDPEPRTRHVPASTCTRRRAPATATPNSAWYQTTTIDGGLQLLAPTEEGADGTGAPGEQLWEPPNTRTAYWFGFVCAPRPFADQRHRGDHRHRAQLGGVGPLHHRHVQRPGGEPVRRALRQRHRPDRLHRPGRLRWQLRHHRRAGRQLQPGDLGRATQLHHEVQTSHRGGRRDRRRQRHRGRRQRGHRGLALVRLAGRPRLQGHQRERQDGPRRAEARQHRRGPALAGRLDQGVDRSPTAAATTSTRPRRAARSAAGSSTSRASPASPPTPAHRCTTSRPTR